MYLYILVELTCKKENLETEQPISSFTIFKVKKKKRKHLGTEKIKHIPGTLWKTGHSCWWPIWMRQKRRISKRQEVSSFGICRYGDPVNYGRKHRKP